MCDASDDYLYEVTLYLPDMDVAHRCLIVILLLSCVLCSLYAMLGYNFQLPFYSFEEKHQSYR